MKTASFHRHVPKATALTLLLFALLIAACSAQQGSEPRAGVSGSAGGSYAGTPARRHESYQEYLDYLVATLKKHWRYEPGPSGGEPEVDLYIEMDRDGGIDTVKIIKPSGNKAFDRSCLQAMRQIQRLDPPPRDWPLTFSMSLSPASLRKPGKSS